MIQSQMFSANQLVPGQQQWTAAGTYSLLVPANCFSLCMVAIGAGGGGARGASGDTNESPAGGGGALSYSNDIAVTPGETLDVVVAAGGGAASGNMSDGYAAGVTSIKRGGTTLVSANGGSGGIWSSGQGGQGGTTGGTGAVKYAGGKGQNSTNFTYGGWSGRYTGQGLGGSGSQSNQSATLTGQDTGTAIGRGGSGGRSSADSGQPGAVRVLWGPGRGFPGNAADV